jgi:5-methylcytosine-specific restriction endonuclease McrA
VKRSPLKPISSKRRKQIAERKAVREQVIARDGKCRALGVWPGHVCEGHVEVHEIVRRSQDSTAWLNPDLCVALCSQGHRDVHDHPDFARQVGLLRHGWEDVA